MARALSGMLLLSICVGFSVPRIQGLIYGSLDAAPAADVLDACHIVHTMPNTASSVRESTTILRVSDVPLPSALKRLAISVFESIGTVTHVPSTIMNAASVTAASTPAFFALVLEGALKGVMAEGVEEGDARKMLAQAMKGCGEMVLRGEAPKDVKKEAMTPGGCTARGISILDAGSVQDVFARAIRGGMERANELDRRES